MKHALTLFVMAAMVVTGCFTAAHAEEKVTLSMIYAQDLTDPVISGNWEELTAAFQKKYPNIEFQADYLFGEVYHTKFQTMIAAGQVPDVIYLWPGKRTAYVTTNNKAKDLRPWLEGHENEFVDGALAAQGPNGEIYEVPERMNYTHIMYTNDKLLKELGLTFPKTLDELIAQGDKIREAGLTPIAMTNGDGWQMQSCFLSVLAERAGGLEWFDKAIKGEGASFADPEFVNALSVIATLSENDMFSAGINQAAYGAGLTEFVTEKAVYYIDGGWRIRNLSVELTEEQQEYVSLRTFPDIPDQKGQSGSTSAVAGTGFGMSADLEGEKAEAAWNWIWFFSGPEGSAIRQKIGDSTAYKLEGNDDAGIMLKKMTAFGAEVATGYVLDAKMDGEGMGQLQSNLQQMMLGAKTPQQVAEEYEAWVAENDSNRK